MTELVTSTTNSLAHLADALRVFQEASNKEKAHTDWFISCTHSAAARRFFAGHRASLTYKITVASITSSLYQKLLDHEANAPVLATKDIRAVRASACALTETLPEAVALPVAARSEEFQRGLSALCQWEPRAGFVSGLKGNPSRRWATVELATAFAEAFDQIPTELVSELIILGWRDTHPRTVSRILDVPATVEILAMAKATVVDRKRQAQSAAVAQQTLHRAALRPAKLSDADRDEIERLQCQIDRISSGRARFLSDTETLRYLLRLAGSLTERSLAEDLIASIELFGKDYGHEL